MTTLDTTFPDRQSSSERNLAPGLARARAIAGRYLLALGMTLLAGVLCWSAQPMLGQGGALIPFVAPVLLAAALVGSGPAITSMLLGAAMAQWVFAPPPAMLFSFYFLTSFLCILISSLLDRWRGEATAARDVAQHRSEQLATALAGVREAQEAAAAGAQRYRTLASATSAIEWATNAAGEIECSSESWERFTGQRWPAYRGLAWLDALGVSEEGGPRDVWKRSLAEGRTFELSARLQEAATGQSRRVSARVVPLRDNRGLVREWIGTIVDEHARAEFEQQLRVSRLWLSLAERAGKIANWSRDRENGRIVWSEGLGSILGSASGAEIEAGDDYFQFVHPDDLDTARLAFEAAANSGQEYETEYRIRRPDGEVRWVSERGRSFVDALQGTNHVCGVTMDVTARKQIEAGARELRASLMEFQTLETERVEAELERARGTIVRQARLAAIGQLSASIAHDLRNPLGVIRNAVYLIRRRLAKGAPAPDLLSMIDEEVVACNTIITNMLEMTRGSEPTRSRVNLEELLKAITQRIDASGKTAWVLELPDGPYEIWCDPNQFRQVFFNLFRNAVEAMKGQGRVTIRARKEGARDLIDVADSGPGIPPAIREQVFEPLVTHTKGGTGLGLMICRQIVERHGGTISLVDTPNAGALFRISMPAYSSGTEGENAHR